MNVTQRVFFLPATKENNTWLFSHNLSSFLKSLGLTIPQPVLKNAKMFDVSFKVSLR